MTELITYHETTVENPSLDVKLITDMKSIQPYSTRDEYLYAMKEDLADWFNSMYATTITADNFIDQLKNGVLICRHANNVMKEGAAKAFKFNISDLNAVGIVNISSLIKNTNSSISAMSERRFSTPSGKSQFAGEFLLYNAEPKTQLYRAYDNITNFIKWCRFIVKVRECLMFETEDLILCKNEKNFILCLLEVARFGSRFGIRVPTIIQLELEIEAEIALETKRLEMEKMNVLYESTPAEHCGKKDFAGATNQPKVESAVVSDNFVEQDMIQEPKTGCIKSLNTVEINKIVDVIDEINTQLENKTEEEPELTEEMKGKKTIIENDSLNKSESSFMDDFVPIENIENNALSNQDSNSKLEWSHTSSSGCQNDETTENSQKNNLKIDNENEDSESHDEDLSYVNDSLEFNNNDEDDEEINKYNENHNINNTNNSSYNLNISQRPDRSEINSVNNTITAVTLINNNLNKNNEQNSVEITSSLTSFSSISSSEATSSNTNALSNRNKESAHSSTTSPSSTASSSPCKFQLSSSSNNSLKNANGENKKADITKLNIDCNFDLITTSSNFSMSSPVYLSSPSSLESTPTSNTDPSAKDEIEQELTKEINELNNSNMPIELNKSVNLKETTQIITKPVIMKSAIPVIKNSYQSPNQSNQQRIVPELSTKYSSHSKIARNIFSNPNRQLNKSLIDEHANTVIPTETTDSQLGRPSLPSQLQAPSQSKDLHNHVCSIANKCTCEKKFLVDKIGEGKYKIGNTKNVVFIRILRNHIMVRVGGGWDTLENYLNKHDPCRCGPESAFSKKFNNHHHHHHHHHLNNTIESLNTSDQSICQNSSKNIILTPVKSVNGTLQNSHFQPNISIAGAKNLTPIHNHLTPNKPGVDFTNAHLIIERNNQGKHQVGKVILKSTSTQLLEDNNNSKKANLNDTCTNCDEMTGIKNLSFNFSQRHQQQSAPMHNSTAPITTKYAPINNNYNDINISNSIQSSSSVQNSIISFNNNSNHHAKVNNITNTPLKTNFNSNLPSPLQKTESVIKSKMKKLINKIPTSNHSNASSPCNSPILNSVRQKHSHKLVEPTTNPLYDLPNNAYSSSTNSASSFYSNGLLLTSMSKPDGLLKFKRTNSTEPSTTGYSSLNEDSDAPTVSVYTETKLPPRLIRKYMKRANTEALHNTERDTESTNTESNTPADHLNLHVKCSDTTSETNSGSNSGIFSSSGLGSPISKNENTIDSHIMLESIKIEQAEQISSMTNKSDEKIKPISFSDDETNEVSVKDSDIDPVSTKESDTDPVSIKDGDTDQLSMKDDDTDSMLIKNSEIDSVSNQEIIETNHRSNQEQEETELLYHDDDDDVFESIETLEVLNGSENVRNIQKNSRRSNARSPPPLLTNMNSSPKPPPRIKKKYCKKSVTTDLSRHIASFNVARKISDADSLEADSIDENETSMKLENVEEPSMSYLFKPAQPPIESSAQRVDSISEESIRENNYLMQKMIADLNDSLENINNKIEAITKDSEITRMVELDHNELNLEEDSLIQNQNKKNLEVSEPDSPIQVLAVEKTKRGQWDKSKLDVPAEPILNKRAQWDKSIKQEMDLMYFNFTMKSAQNAQKQRQIKLNQAKNNNARSSSSKPKQKETLNTQTPKKIRNLNAAKEKLYEMKLNLDLNTSTISTKSSSRVDVKSPVNASMNNTMNNAPIAQQSSQNVNHMRTTPRKVKKRSGERSYTMGLFTDQSPRDRSTENVAYAQSPGRPQLNKTPLRSHSPHLAKTNTQNKSVTSAVGRNKTSSSLHNISHLLNESSDMLPSRRNRNDSYTSTTSNGTHSSYGLSSEYKETKASELRKKTALMNKINKTQQFDPIYSRAHPVSSEINGDQTINHVGNISIGSYEQASAARKRLFAKKNEKNTIYDPNLSICSNGSSTSSATTNSSIPASGTSSINNQRQSRPNKTINYIQNNIDAISKRSNNKLTKTRSKSNNDLYYQLERTNSAQDLFELLNNCEAPRGDLDKYKIMVSETQKLEQHITKIKSRPKKKPQAGAKLINTNHQNKNYEINYNYEKLDAKMHHNDIAQDQTNPQTNSSSDIGAADHKRSRSLPHYTIPNIKPENFHFEIHDSQ